MRSRRADFDGSPKIGMTGHTRIMLGTPVIRQKSVHVVENELLDPGLVPMGHPARPGRGDRSALPERAEPATLSTIGECYGFPSVPCGPGYDISTGLGSPGPGALQLVRSHSYQPTTLVPFGAMVRSYRSRSTTIASVTVRGDVGATS